MVYKKEMTGEQLLHAIDLANLVRSIGNYPKLDDLVPGEPNNPKNCVLAMTFNCDCLIQGKCDDKHIKDTEGYPDEDDYPWFVWFKEKKYADALAFELDEKVFEYDDTNAPQWSREFDQIMFGVILPDDVSDIARMFDDGKLDQKYNMYYADEEEAANLP